MYRILKRLIDLFFSTLLILALFPLFLIISISIFLTMGGSVFFFQKRIGYKNKLFNVYKFRTMRSKSSIDDTDRKRITSLGKFLRKYSLDELPQILNIIKGDMSFIGPRPLLPEYLPYYTERELLRHKVRPGMSGYAQVNGRSYLSWEEQFEMDAQYSEKISFLFDIEIFLKTIPKVLGSVNMIVDGRIDNERFDKYRIKQSGNGSK